MVDRDNHKVAKTLQGADFPADQQTLIDYAAARDADPNTMQVLRTVPDRHYTDLEQVLDTIAQESETRDASGRAE